MPATYPAVTFEQAVDLVEQDVNIFHEILNGDNTTDVPVDVGSVPTIRKAINDMAAYKVPLAWANGVEQTDFLQPRIYSNGFYIPVTVPVTMGVAPDSNWKLFSYAGDQFSDPGWGVAFQDELYLLSDQMAIARANSFTASSLTNSMFICNNCYHDGSDWRRITGTGGGYIEIGESGSTHEFEVKMFDAGAAGGVITFGSTPLDSPIVIRPFGTTGDFIPTTVEYVLKQRTSYSENDIDLEDDIPELVWTSIGPTGSGADFEWADMDVLPSYATYITLSCSISIEAAASGQTGVCLVHTRAMGESPNAIYNMRAKAIIRDEAGQGRAGNITEFKEVLDDNNMFQVRYDFQNVNPAYMFASLQIKGFGY